MSIQQVHEASAKIIDEFLHQLTTWVIDKKNISTADYSKEIDKLIAKVTDMKQLQILLSVEAMSFMKKNRELSLHRWNM